MKNFIETIQLGFNSLFAGFFFGMGIIAAFGIVGLIALNKLLPIINKFVGSL